LDLFNGNTFVATYYSNNTGSFQWNASGVVSGSNYRFKISSNDTAIYAFSPIFSVVGVNGDSYEPDNSPAQASSIQLGTTQKRNIVLGDSDWIKIPAVSGSLYLFEYSCDASLELRAQLCDSGVLSGRYSTLTQDICLSDDSLVSGWICRTSGTYFISLTALSSSYTGNYTIRVSRFDTTVNAKISSPAAGAILSAGSFNTITWTPNAELFGSSVQITIYKGSIPVPPYISTQNTGTYSWLIPVYMENGNDYHIQISRNDSWGVQGSLSPAFSITGGLTADQYEPDNAMSKASVLTLGTTQRHTIPANDTDWVKFQADSGVAYSFIDSTTSLGLHVMLLNFGDGSYITSFDIASGQTTSAWTCPQTAVYASQITIKSSWAGNGTPGTYTTKFSKQ
jgi:hypothetical protein